MTKQSQPGGANNPICLLGEEINVHDVDDSAEEQGELVAVAEAEALTLKKALTGPHAAEFKEAMAVELRALAEYGVFDAATRYFYVTVS